MQIGDENVHRVWVLMDEVFGDENCVAQVATKTSGGSTGMYLAGVQDHVLWYCKSHEHLKYRPLFSPDIRIEPQPDGRGRGREKGAEHPSWEGPRVTDCQGSPAYSFSFGFGTVPTCGP